MRVLPKPVSKTAKTFLFSRRAITACSCSFFSLIPPNFTSHTRCMISANFYSTVYYNIHVHRRSSKGITGQPIKLLRHQSAGHPNRCKKPVQSFFHSSSHARATYGSRSRISRARMLVSFCVLPSVFSYGFSRKRETARSLEQFFLGLILSTSGCTCTTFLLP